MIEILFFVLIATLFMNLYPIVNIVVMLCFALAYLKYRQKSQNPCPIADPFKWLRYAFAFWIISYFVTVGSVSNFFSFDFLRRDGNIFFAYLPLFFIGAYGLRPRDVRRLLNFYLGTFGIVAAVGALQYSAAVGLLPNFLSLVPEQLMVVTAGETSGIEFHALIAAHNAAGGAYAIASIVALSVLLFSEKKPRIFSWPAVLLILMITGLAMTKSRGAYLGFFVAAALVLIRSKADLSRALKPLLIIFIPLVILLARQPQVTARVTSITAGDADPNILIRYELWQRAANYFLSSPIVGVGFSRFNDESLQYYGIRGLLYLATGGEIVNSDAHAHDSFLHFAAEGGIVGLGLMLAVWVAMYRWARWAEGKFQIGTSEYALARAVRACIILEFVISLTEHMMVSAVTTVAIFTLFGLLRNAVASQRAAALISVGRDLIASAQPARHTGTISGASSAEFST